MTPKVEVGVNVAITHFSDDGGNFTLFQPNAKYKFYAERRRGARGSGGHHRLLSANHRTTATSFGQVYGKRQQEDQERGEIHRRRVGLHLARRGNTGGVLAGYEQPLGGSKVSFVADWFSGKNFWGYFTPGISVTLPHNGLLNIGYSIGNDSLERRPGNDTHNKRAVRVLRHHVPVRKRGRVPIRRLDRPDLRGQDVPGVVDDEVAMV